MVYNHLDTRDLKRRGLTSVRMDAILPAVCSLKDGPRTSVTHARCGFISKPTRFKIRKLQTFTGDKNVPVFDAESYLRAEARATGRFI
jgi:hypothetical protein